MSGDSSLNPIRSALTAAFLWLEGRLRLPGDRIGDVLVTESGQSFTVYRETTVTPDDPAHTDASAILAFRFHLRLVPDSVVPYAVRVFEPVSILTTPFFAGLPGFRTKLWLSDHDTDDYQGVYEWASAQDAKRYARALGQLMDHLWILGSVSHEVVEDTTLDEYIATHSPEKRGRDSPSWRTPTRRGAAAGVLVATLGAVYWALVRPWYLQWGTTAAELDRELPGHDLAPDPAVHSTQAVTVDASPADVWPWLVQIGQGRGGFYSYDWLERLVGADIYNVDRIIPEYQDLREDDEVLLAPKNYVLGSPDSWPVVASLEEGRSIVLRPPGEQPTYVWTFLVEPTDEGKTRLIARMRSPRKPTALGRLVEAVTWEPAHFLMQRKMLLGARDRAEDQTEDANPMTRSLLGW